MRILIATIFLTVLAMTAVAQEDFRPRKELLAVAAKAGETVADLANRVGADADDIARFNGLLPTTRLGAGRLVSIPAKFVGCRKTIAESPELRGLKLGMAKADFIALLDPKVRSTFEVIPRAPDYYFLDRVRFAGLSGVSTEFVSDKLSVLKVEYDRDVSWRDDEEFAATVSEKLNLPSKLWTKDFDSLVMDCGDVLIKARQNSVELIDVTALNTKAQSDRREAERKKKEFKP